MRLKDKVCIITGAGSGIGAEMAPMFAEEGGRLVVADVNASGARETAARIEAEGGEALAVVVDITQADQVEAMVESTLDRFGRVDVLVNNAGVGLNRPFLETTLEEWERVVGVVLTGTFLCSQIIARVMVEQGAGRIVNVGSISGQRGAQGRAAYGAAKAGVLQLTRVMALELAPQGVYVNAISPGPVDTPQSRRTHTAATRQAYLDRMPLGRYGERREVAAAALFLSSDEAGFAVGSVLNVDGGFHATGLRFDPEAE